MTDQSLDAVKKFASVTVIALALIILSILFLDRPAALYAYHHNPVRIIIDMLLGSLTGPTSTKMEIPDFLMPMTVLITVASWTAYWLRVRRGYFDHHTYFFKMVGTTVPFAFLAKSITKFMFGRINTRVWVSNPVSSINFHWFNGVGNYHGFPSGHMAVLTPLFIALWHFYPRLRLLWGATLSSLAIALVLTYYHFVSDVIAGTYLGLLVYCLCLKKLVPDTPPCSEVIWPKWPLSRNRSR